VSLLLQMTACFQMLLLLLLPVVVQVCGGPPATQEGRYRNSLLFTRQARTNVGQLLRTYVSQMSLALRYQILFYFINYNI